MNIVKRLRYFFRKKWCVVNISDMGGGYATQQYIINPLHEHPNQVRHWLFNTQATSTKEKCHVYQNQIHKWFYTRRAAVKYAAEHAKDYYFSYIVNAQYEQVPNVFAVCHLENTEEKLDTVTVTNLYATKNNEPSLGKVYSVDLPCGRFPPHTLCPDNVWMYRSSAERYKNTFHDPDLFVITQI